MSTPIANTSDLQTQVGGIRVQRVSTVPCHTDTEGVRVRCPRIVLVSQCFRAYVVSSSLVIPNHDLVAGPVILKDAPCQRFAVYRWGLRGFGHALALLEPAILPARWG